MRLTRRERRNDAERKKCKHCSKWLRKEEIAKYGVLCFRCGENTPADQQRIIVQAARVENDGQRAMRLRAMPYAEYLKTPDWFKTGTRKLNNAGKRCQVCGSRNNLEVHHNNYDHIGSEHDNDLVVLCGECHSVFHDHVDRLARAAGARGG